VAYRLLVGDDEKEGTTDGSSPIEMPVPRGATSGVLLAWPTSLPADQRTEDNADVWRLALGGLDPHDTVSGAQARLANLGFYGGAADGQLSPETRAALQAFQKAQGLEASGELDDSTQSALASAHDG
jgi:peptidoglycan hydrolase-like protein with peptidoglycan-binding domain